MANLFNERVRSFNFKPLAGHLNAIKEAATIALACAGTDPFGGANCPLWLLCALPISGIVFTQYNRHAK